MGAEFFTIPGEMVAPESITTRKAQELLALLTKKLYPYARLEYAFRHSDGREGAIVDLSVEVGQEPLSDIRDLERVALLFDYQDASYPEILALRPDFPLVPHLNLREQEYPKSLCIYEESYALVKLSWTPTRFLERIRMWFRETATGALHRDDQPLEPILMPGPSRLVIPSDLFTRGNNDAPERLWVSPRYAGVGGELLMAKRPEKVTPHERQLAQPYLATTFQCQPQIHGVIRKLPKSLRDVHDLVVGAGLDLLSELRSSMLGWQRSEAPLDARLIVVVFFPKLRNAGKPPEVSDVWAFVTVESIRAIGLRMGFWGSAPGGQVAALVGADIDPRLASAVQVLVLNPSYALDRSQAAVHNGSVPSDKRITAVGVGALGSQVMTKLVRGGFGIWTLIDMDQLLPHNLARHELTGSAVGFPKAIGMQMICNDVLEDVAVAEAIVANVQHPGESREQVASALVHSELILDFSAAIPVARHLAATIGGPRHVSAYLNANATDLVIIAEDAERRYRLDDLEMQYYRAIISEPKLQGHLAVGTSARIRYAQTCRDLTSSIPEELVGLHSAIAARAVRFVADNREASILVWRSSPDLAVQSLSVAVSPVIEVHQGDWTIRTDECVRARLGALRAARLPNETGGVLVGTFDLERRIAYIVDILASPPDSKEWPTLYIRGCEGLAQRLREIDEETVGMLQYMGEWHSHPDGCAARPSAEDEKAFRWLADHMQLFGLPPIMAIVGAGANIGWFLGSLQ